MMTATEASKSLGISRNTFYLRVKDLGIELVKSGRNSMVQAEDVQRIRAALGTKRQNVSSVLGRNARTPTTGQVGHADDSRQEVIDELRNQNHFLKQQLDAEQATSAKLLEQMNQGQQLMLAMQTETMRLRSENQKLLLEHPPTTTKNESPRAFDPPTEGIRSDIVIQQKTNWAWRGMTLAAAGVLGWVLYQLPSLEALQFAGW